MSTAGTLTLSEAFHLIFCIEATWNTSPPFGNTTVTDGFWVSIGTVPGAPALAGRGILLQSRSCTTVTVMLPVPAGAELVTATLNRVPLVAVGPQMSSTASSTV